MSALDYLRARTPGGSLVPPAYRARPRPFPFPGASLHLDFVGGRYFRRDLGIVNSLAAAGVSFSRATQAWYENAAGVIVPAAINEAVREWSNGVCQGLRIEEARTNKVRNPTMAGAATGTPGTVPASWSIFAGGLTQEIIGLPAVNGMQCMDLRFSGTASSTSLSISAALAGEVPASVGQAWSASAFLAHLAGSLPATSLRIRAYDAIPANVGDNSSSNLSLSPVLRRVSIAGQTLAAATTASIVPMVRISLVAGNTYDFTIRIAAPQLELGAQISSPILLGSGSAVARAADFVSMASAAVLPWFSASSGTFICRGRVLNSEQVVCPFRVTEGSTLRGIGAHVDNRAAQKKALFQTRNSVAQAAPASPVGTVATDGRFSLSGAWGGRVSVSASGSGIAQVSPAYVFGTESTLEIGGSKLISGTDNVKFNGFIEELIYLPAEKSSPHLIAASK